jgi:hypothetical protein
VSVAARLFFFRLLALAPLLLLGACAPPLAPAYLDYQAPAEPQAASLPAALEAAGWTVDPTASAALTTQPRTFTRAGVYRIEAHLEALPLAGGHVRVLVHPYRVYFDGARSKIGYLPQSLRRSIAPDLDAAMQEHGFTATLDAEGREPDR